MEVGIDSFAARFDDVGLAASHVDRMRELLERIDQADQVGPAVSESASTTNGSSSTRRRR